MCCSVWGMFICLRVTPNTYYWINERLHTFCFFTKRIINRRTGAAAAKNVTIMKNLFVVFLTFAFAGMALCSCFPDTPGPDDDPTGETDNGNGNGNGNNPPGGNGNTNQNGVISFEDAVVKSICVERWDTSGDGELSYAEAAAVTSLGDAFSCYEVDEVPFVEFFTELQYFTGLDSIEDRAFYGCAMLKKIIIPQSVTSIGYRAFQYCYNLTDFDIPAGVTDIGVDAFSSCESLTTVEVPAGISKISSGMFHQCASLENVTLPNGLTLIDAQAFVRCTSLESIIIPDSVTFIDVCAFTGCTALKHITLPANLSELHNFAFEDCTSLESVTVPRGGFTIMPAVFMGCSSLRTFYGDCVSDDNRCLIFEEGLVGFASNGLTEYTVPVEAFSIGVSVFSKTPLHRISIPGSVNSIKGAAFSKCQSLSRVDIGDGVMSIGDEAFRDCPSLKSVTIPASVGELGDMIFRDSAVEEVYLNCNTPDYETFGGNDPFGASAVTTVVVGHGVESIGSNTFAGCITLKTLSLPSTLRSIGADNVVYGDALEVIYCKATVPPTMSQYSFENMTASVKIYVPTASVDAYKAAEGWKDYAGQIVGRDFSSESL